MSKELAKNLRIITLRNGAEIPVEADKLSPAFMERLSSGGFVEIGDEIINTKDIIGILDPATLDAVNRRRSGQWQDKNGQWRNKGDYVCSECGNFIPRGKFCGYCGQVYLTE